MVHFLKKYFISWGAMAPMGPPGYATVSGMARLWELWELGPGPKN